MSDPTTVEIRRPASVRGDVVQHADAPWQGVRRLSDSQSALHANVLDIAAPCEEWDAFVNSVPEGDIVQSSLWGLSKVALGQPSSIVTIRGKDAAIAGGALLIERRVVSGVRIGYIARGPVVCGEDPEILAACVNALLARAHTCGLRALILQPAKNSVALDAAMDRFGFVVGSFPVGPEATVRIDVTQTDDALLQAMSAMRRRNLRKAGKEQVAVVHSDDVAEFHRLHLATSSRKGFNALSLRYLEAQWAALAPSGAATILLACHDGTAVAGLWLSKFGGVVTFRLAGWDAAAAGSLHVNEALHWAAIRWARASGAHTYDFGGFDRETAESILAGRALPADFEKTHNFFKLGFNAVPILLPGARFRVLNRTAHGIARALFPSLRRAPLVRRLAQRLRSA